MKANKDMNRSKELKDIFREMSVDTDNLMHNLMKSRQAQDGYTPPDRVETVKCENCGQERTNMYFGDEIKSYCFSAKCDPKMKGIKPRELKTMEFYWSFSKVPLSLKEANFKSYERDNPQRKLAYQGANYYAHEVTKENPIILRIHGSNGTGKSHLALSVLKIIRDRSEDRMTCMFISHQEIMETIQKAWDDGHEHAQDYYYRIFQNVDLLCIDDLGVSSSRFAKECITKIIDSRSGKPLIFTTNLSVKQLESDSAYSRIDSKTSSKAHIIELVSDDYRKKDVKLLKAVKTSQEQMTMNDMTLTPKQVNGEVPYDLDDPPF